MAYSHTLVVHTLVFGKLSQTCKKRPPFKNLVSLTPQAGTNLQKRKYRVLNEKVQVYEEKTDLHSLRALANLS